MKAHEACPNCGWDLSRAPSNPTVHATRSEVSNNADPLLVPLADRIEYLSPDHKREKDERRHKRIRMAIKAAIQFNGDEEVVDVQDISKLGLRFFSMKLYPPGTIVQVAAPYAFGGNNIFADARIIRAHRRPTKFLAGDYALEILP